MKKLINNRFFYLEGTIEITIKSSKEKEFVINLHNFSS